MGLNEAAGYGAVAATSLLAGYLAGQHGLRPVPFLLGIAYTALALLLSGVFVRETRPHALLDAGNMAVRGTEGRPGLDTNLSNLSNSQIFSLTSFREPALSSASVAGMVNNLNFGLSWGLFPLLFATSDLSTGQIGLLFALYPGVWGIGQMATGALSDRIGRKHLITAGMLVQAGALTVIALGHGFGAWASGTVLLGAGTAMVYPTLLAAVGDVAHPAWRGRAVGVYRVWRDLGYAVGAITGGIIADLMGLPAALWMAAALSAAAGLAVAVRMYETHPPRPRQMLADDASAMFPRDHTNP